MTVSSEGSPHRGVRILARLASAWMVAVAVAVGPWSIGTAGATESSSTAGLTPGATAAAGGSTSPGSSVSALQIQAQELAGQIDADGQQLDQLDASYQEASINYQRLTVRQDAMRQAMAATTAQVAAARLALKQQAILAYVAGGAPMITQIPDRPGVDRSLTVAYAEIVAGGQQRAVQNYRDTLEAQAREQAALDANRAQMAITMGTLKSDADQAAVTLTAQRQTLAQVTGQLAAAVAQVQARQQAAQQAQEQAVLTAQGVQLPASGAGPQTAVASSSPNTGGSTPPAPVTRVTSPRAPVSHAPVTKAPASQPPPTSPPVTAPPSGGDGSGGSGAVPAQAPGVAQVLAYARAQLGKPYQWAGAGPDSFDCSGLVMRAWEQAGINFPHLAQDQYDLTARLPLADLIPGDLVFFGTPDDVYHVGIYVGSGDMIDAPETGQNVQVQSIYWDTLLGGGRVSTSS